ncbi:hypothetical protein B7990_02570 [Fibrobacter sp. UWB4]|nr:hypothetical protein B7990_02570 [Fibrobacter sp. UWB4]
MQKVAPKRDDLVICHAGLSLVILSVAKTTQKASMPQGENALRREMQDSLLSYIRADSMMRSIYAAVVLAQIWLSRLARREASMLRPCLHGHNRAKELGLCPIQ